MRKVTYNEKIRPLRTTRSTRDLDIRAIRTKEAENSTLNNSSTFWQNNSLRNLRNKSSRWSVLDPTRPFKHYQKKDKLKVEVLELDKWKFMHLNGILFLVFTKRKQIS